MVYSFQHISRAKIINNLQPRGECPGWISIIFDPTSVAKTCALLHLRRNLSRSYWGRWWNLPFPSASGLPDTGTRHTKQLFHVVPVSLCLCLEASENSWELWFGMWRNVLAIKAKQKCLVHRTLGTCSKTTASISNDLQGQTSSSAEHLKSSSHSALPQPKQKCACLSVSFIYCVQLLHMNSTQPILSFSAEPDWYDPKTSCLFAALLPFLPWKHMQSTPIHSVCHSICEGLLLGPYSSGRPMFLGSPQPSQQNHGKQSIPQWFSAVVLCCIHLMFLLLLFFFCSGCTSDFRHCESIITSRVANTKNIFRHL